MRGTNIITITLILLFYNQKVLSQDFDTLVITVAKDTIRKHEDAALNVRLFRKDSKLFFIPDKISFGSVYDIYPDLIIEVEKADSIGFFREFVCKYSNIPLPGFLAKKIKYREVSELSMVDDLDCIECIDSGFYRIRVCYNKKMNDGYINPPNITVQSGWVYLRVLAPEIILSNYRRNMKKNGD